MVINMENMICNRIEEIEQWITPYIDFTQLIQPLVQIDTEEINRIVEEFNNVGEVYPISAADLNKTLERYGNEEDNS